MSSLTKFPFLFIEFKNRLIPVSRIKEISIKGALRNDIECSALDADCIKNKLDDKPVIVIKLIDDTEDVWEFSRPDIRDKVWSAIKAMLSTGPRKIMEFELRKKTHTMRK